MILMEREMGGVGLGMRLCGGVENAVYVAEVLPGSVAGWFVV